MPIASSPRSIPSAGSSPSRYTPSPTESMVDIFPRYAASISSSGPSCAFPSWPTGKSLFSLPQRAPSAFVSDEDLFPVEFDDEADTRSATILREAPAPPRERPYPAAAPVFRPAPPKQEKKKRRRSSTKQRRGSKPMTPITESPEEVE
ncbi:MAG: hypothetical protein M1820_001229 [Bogoriella megaspora]|nr:MAG: hypothetical protein M1820_001229 [Bogoriella megaspora]